LSPDINGRRVNFQDNSTSLCYGLWMLFKQDDADNFERWQFDNKLPSSYDQEQAQEAICLLEQHGLHRKFSLEIAKLYTGIHK